MAALLNPSAMTVPETAQVLTRLGNREVTEAMVAEDVAAGATVNPDGTINIVHYTAWMVREVVGRGD